MKCLNQTYKVGKTYTSDGLMMCLKGIHFCKKMEDTLQYYTFSQEFVLLEIEVLGEIIDGSYNKSVTNKMKVLRVLNMYDYTQEMIKRLPLAAYTPTGKVSRLYGHEYTYDQNDNLLSHSHQAKRAYYKYDSSNRLIKIIDESGTTIYTSTYDSNGHLIYAVYPNGGYVFTNDINGNRLTEKIMGNDDYVYNYPPYLKEED